MEWAEWLVDETQMQARAAALAPHLRAGDALLLNGPVGAGKSAFARALIQSRSGALIEVPSPTYTIVQSYQTPDLEIWHADLYRLCDWQEAEELGFEAAFVEALTLIEWPDRLGPLTPARHLRLDFSDHAQGRARLIRISGAGSWDLPL